MRPDENDNRRSGTPLIPQRSFVHTPPSNLQRSDSTANQQAQASAAADIIRGQIDSLYQQDTNHAAPAQPAAAAQPTTQAQQQPQPAATAPTDDTAQQPSLDYKSPYQRTQMNPGQVQSSQWKQYHSAWQDYYQKYYERYYISQVQRTQTALEARAAQAASSPAMAGQAAAGNSSSTQQTAPSTADDSTSRRRDQALHELRNKLRGQITSSAVKVRKSRHFMPIVAAACVMVVFLFLQYNRVLFANVEAYISPGNVNSANVIIDPTSELSVGDEPRLIIPKINVDVPVDYTATPDHDSQMKSMENGLAWFGIPGANSKPGQIGNTVLSGHSSNDIIDQGAYKFIFARLDALKVGDNIYANYEGKRYVYRVTKKEVVKPSQVGKLIYDTDKPMLTLITCTPLGTAINRLLVTAEQISPSTDQAKAAPAQTAEPEEVAMPGNSPTFLQRIFGAGD